MSAVIALAGLAGSGKSTAANYLIEKHGFVRVKFAGPLKDMLRAFGLTDAHIEGPLKELPTPLLCGQTPRHAMQTLGTEWRDLIHRDLWINMWSQTVTDVLDRGGRVVTDDCRFSHEASVVAGFGGVVARVACPWAGLATGGGHASENGGLAHDVVIWNDEKDNLDRLYRQLDELVG